MKRFQLKRLPIVCQAILFGMGMSVFAFSQEPNAHSSFFQAVKIQSSPEVCIAPATEGQFLEPMPMPQIFGLKLFTPYRFRITGIPLHPGVELFPTVELLDRTFPPMNQELKFPILIEISQTDLQAAIQGKFITRVIYVEDPQTALPIVETAESGQGCFDVPREADPLAVAKTLGRPVAILRLGARVPSVEGGYDDAFLFGCPDFYHYTPAD
ncbi:MAG: hypothetical protein Q4D62_11235 [Planctomycetia bacterium]|nr:hypothetical protein [Planctomycetia bacterium]